MVRAEDFIPDEVLFYFRPQGGGSAEIIDPPTHVPSTGSSAITPPGILDALGKFLAITIDKALTEKRAHPGPLSGRKARTADVLFGPGQIDL
jgi:hypothetical protein